MNNPKKVRKRTYLKKEIVHNPEPPPTVALAVLPAIPPEPPVTAVKADRTPPGPMITAEGIVRCRFDLFVRFHTGIVSYFPNQERCFCYRGDKFTDEQYKMLRNLLKLVANKGQDFFLMELYDNTLPKEDGQRLILKIMGNKIKHNRMAEYSRLLKGFPLEDILKPYQHDDTEITAG